MAINGTLGRRLRMGMIGGGQGSFIGKVHVMAAGLDGRSELVAGALSSDPEKARRSAADYGLDRSRGYGTVEEMLQAEALRADRPDFMTIATPNHTHFPLAKACLAAGFHVMCDKPLTLTVEEARELQEDVKRSGRLFGLMHNYTGYSLIRQAHEMVRTGELGEVLAVRATYLQGSAHRDPQVYPSRSAWRSDPRRAGPSGCFGDIGTHAYNLARFVTGLVPESVSSRLCTFMPGKELDDYGVALVRFDRGALGTITASKVSHGHTNDLRLQVDGSKGSLEWHQEDPHRLHVRTTGSADRLYGRDPHAAHLASAVRAAARLPAGHPESFLEAFANVYAAFFDALVAHLQSEPLPQALYPGVADGVDGMIFVHQCLASSRQAGAWISLCVKDM
jgi:predicted dehydrogenase